ncbi:hypothetical protein [Streptomyces sp. NPDC005969]|uniref:hypothetical protein n=1 Tax=Streptomyces sp. NPDC005969 TaxID=3156722 RepID=UPI0033ED54B1
MIELLIGQGAAHAFTQHFAGSGDTLGDLGRGGLLGGQLVDEPAQAQPALLGQLGEMVARLFRHLDGCSSHSFTVEPLRPMGDGCPAVRKSPEISVQE